VLENFRSDVTVQTGFLFFVDQTECI
jgi:hypothetical protein